MESSYNVWLVALSIVIAFLASYTSLNLASRVTAARGAVGVYWLVGGAFSMGLGIWAMHFVGMLAFSLPIPIAYDLPITLGSIVPALVSSGLALYVVGRREPTLPTLTVSALLMGCGIVVMHYSGMAAMKMSPAIAYDPARYTLSVLVAIGASLVALRLAFRSSSGASVAQRLGSAALMGIAIAGMHYLGMFAANFAPDSLCLAGPGGADARWLAINVGGGTLLILGFTITTTFFDSALAQQNARTVTGLRRMNAELEHKAAEIAQEMTRELRDSQARLLERESSLREVNERLEAVIGSSPVAIYTRNLDGIVTSWNPAAEKMFGWSESEIVGRMLSTVPADKLRESEELRARLLNGEPVVDVEVRRQKRDGSPIDIRSTLAPLHDAQGNTYGYIAVATDITERKRTEGMLRLSAQVFENASEGIMVTDADSTIVAVNHAFTLITGYSAEEAIGRSSRMLHQQDPEFYASLRDSLDRDGHWQGELWERRKNGDAYAQWANIATVRDEHDQITHYVAVISDITARKEAERRLGYLATHDALTGLKNRSIFFESLQHAIARARRGNDRLALLFLDIDNFKAINDTLGHHAGDHLLREIAARLAGCVRESDTVARQGGDEFTVMIEDLTSSDEAAQIAKKILDTLAPKFVVAEREVFVTASIGIDIFPTDSGEAEDLLKNADAAMYHAKEQGRNNYQFYSAELNAAAHKRLSLEGGLRRAIEREEFVLHYQPQVTLRGARLVGAEALLRWNHPERGLVMPDEFIPVAESCGLIVPIGEWVLRTACAQNRRWQAAGLPELPVAVNISARQFRPDFVRIVRQVLADTGLDARYLELEITETLLMKNIEATTASLGLLNDLGVALAVDDFGTGYSSLYYLKRFPVDKLKIERAFVQDITVDPDDAALVRAIVNLGHSLGLRVTAEGVETEEHFAYLLGAGCDEGQGYHFGRPVAASEYEALLRASIDYSSGSAVVFTRT
ncbi:MAG: EAL domain-containing protein [Betaproteobacteria bacterium]|nr:EAL domain-containing protein [Betaproteobacteria bacterium]